MTPFDYQLEQASNPKTSKRILDQLSRHTNVYIRRAVAKNLNSSQESLIRLSKDFDLIVCGRIAYNPNTPETIKKRLSGRDGWFYLQPSYYSYIRKK